ncbi:hypothetical protein Sango_0583100 [Sesamum angolense]|uniref:Uncharacterized protein n=1 Tax=Sesamum angolense TaxID=2727404 RepID=A0AAE1X622_9LAMI|nr:hypothetical protein Sango_0583100 [Sesamum angolense]
MGGKSCGGGRSVRKRKGVATGRRKGEAAALGEVVGVGGGARGGRWWLGAAVMAVVAGRRSSGESSCKELVSLETTSEQNLDRNSIILDIKEELNELPSRYSRPSIFKVDDYLRSGGWDNVYDPEIVAIGPYHHGKTHLKYMELHKFRYLKRLLDRRNENQADHYIDAVIGMEERARKCYAGSIDLSKNDFVKLMVRDGCFLIELLRYHGLKNLRDPDDPILQERTLSQLRHDIVLVENQLPFFLLNQLFIMTKSEDPNDDIISLTLLFVKGMFLNLSAPTVLQGNIGKNNQASAVEWDNINSASGLREAGIKFKKAKDYTSLMDINYSQTFADVNKHYRRRTKKWLAKLWRDYFNSPWSILKFLAAVALLALAFLQTFYTVYSYYNLKTNSNGPPSGS